MSLTGNFFFAARNQPNYAWWRPLGEILAVAVLAVLFTGVLDLSLGAAGIDTSSGAADKYFGYGSVIVEILAVLVAVWLIGRRPVSSVFTGQPATKPWVPFAAFAVAVVVIFAMMSLVGVYGYGASWGQVVGNMGADFPVELVALLFAALAGLLVLPYLASAWPFRSLSDADSERAHAAWRRFLRLNLLSGFLLTQLLLVIALTG